MQIFLYEFITGGGMYSLSPNEPPSGSLLNEGRAMIAALATDFSRLAETSVTILRDRRLVDLEVPKSVEVVDVASAERERELINRNAATADLTVVIAPEFDELLLHRVKQVEAVGGRLVSPSSKFVAATQNKHLTSMTLQQAGVPTPNGRELRGGEPLPNDVSLPAVIKPVLGVGSTDMMLVESADAALPSDGTFRIEEYCSGVAASVAVLCGRAAYFPLPATRQRIKDDGTFGYLGGCVPLPKPLRTRAERLALQALEALPKCVGYVGIDVILAETDDERDVVIEVNPRLTTSCIGLREVARGNLAQAMVDVAEGKEPDLSFDDGPVEFLADGTIVS